MTAKEMLEKHLNPYYMNGALAKQAEKAMKEYALHIAEQAVKEENEFWLGDSSGLINRTCKNILTRIKQLTEEK